MKKTLLICAGLIFLFINARIIYEILTPPGEKVRARLAQVAEDFNEGRPGPCTSGLADQFVDETTKITKPEIRGLLARLALTEKDPQSGHFPYRVQLQLKELGYKVSSGTPPAGRVEFDATFEKQRGEEWDLFWKVSITAHLEEVDGWQIVRSTHQTLAGRRFR